MKVDLGCGSQKNPRFIGIDRRHGPDVDLTCVIQLGIPLPDDSVDMLSTVSTIGVEGVSSARSRVFTIWIEGTTAISTTSPFRQLLLA